MAQESPQTGHGEAQDAPESAHERFKSGPRAYQEMIFLGGVVSHGFDYHTLPHDAIKTVQQASTWRQDGLKRRQNGRKMAPRRSHLPV